MSNSTEAASPDETDSTIANSTSETDLSSSSPGLSKIHLAAIIVAPLCLIIIIASLVYYLVFRKATTKEPSAPLDNAEKPVALLPVRIKTVVSMRKPIIKSAFKSQLGDDTDLKSLAAPSKSVRSHSPKDPRHKSQSPRRKPSNASM